VFDPSSASCMRNDMKTNFHKNKFSSKEVIICLATALDLAEMVALSYKKRRDYESAQPQFWRYAIGAEEVQSKWFEKLLENKNAILLVAKSETKIVGFAIGQLVPAPEHWGSDTCG
jgi:hypothetical protein